MRFTSVSTLLAGVSFMLPAFASNTSHCYLRDASAPTPTTAYALCAQGLVYSTADSGATWAPHDTGATQDLHAIAFSDAAHGYAVGDGGTLLATDDAGKTWQKRTVGTTEHLLAVFGLGKLVWAGGFDGVVLQSSDGGVTWVKQKSGTTMAIEGIYFIDPDHGWAVGWSGTVLRTDNGGKAWQVITTDAASWSLASVRFRDLKNGWAVGFSGQLLRTRDGGITWQAQKSSTQSWLSSIAFDKNNRIWIAADSQLLMSEDGDVWKPVPIESNQFVTKLFSLGGKMWALGELGLVAQTGNGTQWKRDQSLVPAGSQIPSTLEDTTATVAAATASTGKN